MERTAISLTKLFRQIPLQDIRGSKDIDVLGVTAHSKLVAPGDLFIAKKGLTVDGARFIPDAVAAGAVAVLTEVYNPSVSVTQLIHPDVASIEALVARTFYSAPDEDLFLVGITGTNGKTTTSYLIRHILDLPSSPCGLIGTVQWLVGSRALTATHTTPELLQTYALLAQMRAARCSSCVMEVSSHALHQGRVKDLEFDVAVFTNLTQDHLDYHATMHDYAEAKRLLFSSLKEGKKSGRKTAVINADSPYHAFMGASVQASLLSYGVEASCDLKATEVKLSAQGVQFLASYGGKQQLFSSPLIGRYNVYNLLAAIGVGLVRGLSLQEIAERCKTPCYVPGRLEPVPNKRGVHVFVDYAHTEDALANVLTTLHELKKGRLITVFGCGGNRDPFKRPKMGAVAEQYSDIVIITTDNPRQESPEEISHQILSGFKDPTRAFVVLDRKEAIERAVFLAQPGDMVLIAGKGHERQQIFSGSVKDFDDCAMAKAAGEASLAEES